MRGARPTALICGNDLIAISAMEGLRRLGLEPGEDVALIGCDDIPVAAHVRPALTTFNLDLEALGIKLGQMMVARLGSFSAATATTLSAFEKSARMQVPTLRQSIITLATNAACTSPASDMPSLAVSTTSPSTSLLE